MADGFQLGRSRRRASSGESWLFALAIAVGIFAFWRYSPIAPGAWEAAATQAHKKLPRTVLFYPAWEREVLARMRALPVVLLDGPAHLDLAGLKEVLFASEIVEPDAVVRNLFALVEWRDFAGKPFALLRVADRSVSHDFAGMGVFVEDPPGIEQCHRDGSSFKCRDTLVELRRATFGESQSRCVWVQTPKGRDVSLRFARTSEDEALKEAALYLGVPDGQVGTTARANLRINDNVVASLDLGIEAGRWQQGRTVLAPGTHSIEVSVTSDTGVCIDAELMK